MTIGSDSGGITEDDVTEPRPWPNDMKTYRDQSAERTERAMKLLKQLLKHTDPVVVRTAAMANDELFCVIRWLQLAGSQTKPDEL